MIMSRQIRRQSHHIPTASTLVAQHTGT